MRRIGVVDAEDGVFIKTAGKKLPAFDIELIKWNPTENYDAVLICDGAPKTDNKIRCGIVITPDTGMYDIKSASAVSFGMSPLSTVTVSSMTGDSMCVALRRDIIDFDGHTIPRQEFIFDWSMSAYNALPITTLIILSGK